PSSLSGRWDGVKLPHHFTGQFGNPMDAAQESGTFTSYWRENKLFIFDDTLLHQSFNETDQTRYCLFVDMVRPSPFPGVMRAVISGVRFFTQSFKFIYYQNWKVIEQ